MVVSLFGNEKAFNEDFHITEMKNDIHWDDVIEISGKILGVKPSIYSCISQWITENMARNI